ncbi:acyl transferase domain-containing protein [Actinophytocola oryzae]|uniref:Acyl transferase domain-containing protein n=2 Tax=Actinophytocola oryzae TaxID=502181 RepID=A0A4R7W1T2_9PSEU|nr:type I polyketide synthase [Actinophytocola oryzae]TDV56075.1 acyl transferase domain-containing protein [Actinophytocola oryzae]
MSLRTDPDTVVLGFDPLRRPNARLAAAVRAGGGLGVVDLPGDARTARRTLGDARAWCAGRFGVRVGATCAPGPGDLPADVEVVVLAADAAWPLSTLPGRVVLAEVTDVVSARTAVAAGVDGLIARGAEAGGPVGTLSTFALLQHLLAAVDVPVWACGGIGPHSAAAALACGAAGVVLDVALAAYPEAGVAGHVVAALSRVDGGTDAVRDGRHPAAFGQDAGLATRFRDRWATVPAALRGVRDHLATALRTRAPGRSPTGTALPLAQGPMTRVSDQPAFAAAVAEDGALPFVALSLSDGQASADLMAATNLAVDGRPWGVGILGFADDALRTAQLAAVAAARPSHAIVAGGRPAQAEELESLGVRTFLHAPSPLLLDGFLRAGTRRFVFEGAECGGHVGPRSAFVLWDEQVAVLDAFLAEHPEAAAEIDVLFAGGVHDARSAAAVTALAAPLTAAGAAVGMLMGTAYLFTEEAVATGAIGAVFQREVLNASGTALVRTGPGYVTRCVPSPFVTALPEHAARLRAAGLSDPAVRDALEELCVGRLRTASRGLVRTEAGLAAVDEDRQLADGLFMAGEVAGLRSTTTTVEALHRAVTEGAADVLAGRARELLGRLGAERVPAPTPAPLDIAIIGMAGVFPGAPDLAAFWANVLADTESITEVPGNRWDTERYYSPGATAGSDRTPSKWGGFLPPIPFDPLRHGLPPASLTSVEPVQLLALEVAARALADAGYDGPDTDRSRCSVVFGAESGSELSAAVTLRSVLPAYLGELPADLAEQLPTITEDTFPGTLANVIAGRVANRLDLGGGNYTVDAACASSLAAVELACRELAAGASDLVLCGGADLHNGIQDYVMFGSVQALSPTGRSRAFDAAADGIVLGEGVGCVVLKRLADARRDGDRVYAVIAGTGSASDGRSLGIVAPRPEGQRRALDRAYRTAGLSPAEVGLIEAHGTGTSVGDRTELRTLTEAFTAAGASTGGCALGSVKSLIGHTKCAAGMAGLIKAALAVHHGVLPPTGHLERPNPLWDADTSPFAFHPATRPWAVPAARRVAGVSSFGFGGTNFHAVLRGVPDAPPARHAADQWPAELVLVRGHDTASANRSVTRLLELARHPGTRVRDLALTASLSDRDEPVRFAVVTRDTTQLVEQLSGLLAGATPAGVHRAVPGAAPGPVAFLFPGQGSQSPGMLAELYAHFPELRRHLPDDDPAWLRAWLAPSAFDESERARQHATLTDTSAAQPALGAAGMAVHDLLVAAGVRPDAVAGHSYGEVVALAAAGALAPELLAWLSGRRAEAVLASTGDDPGTMAAVAADPATVRAVLDSAGLADRVVVANHNAPAQSVLAGPTDLMARAVAVVRDSGHSATPLPVACAFHSPLVGGAADRFTSVLSEVPVTAPEIPVWSNRTARPYPADPAGVRAELAAQLTAPVRFADQITAMHDAGIRTFVEAGPGTVLSRLVDATLTDRPHQTVNLGGPDAGVAGFLSALGALAVTGVPVDTDWLFTGRDAVDVTTRAEPPRWTLDGRGAHEVGGETPTRRPPRLVSLARPPADRDAMVTEFLQAGRDLVAAQRDVLVAYLGGPAAPAARPAPVELPEEPRETTTVAVGEDTALRRVLSAISDRTGYPVDMIDPDTDLEAALSIDSIKRAEIAADLASALGTTPQRLEAVSTARTAADMAARLTGAAVPTATPPTTPPAPHVEAARRFVLAPVPRELTGPASDLAGRTVVVVGTSDITTSLTDQLRDLGATVRVIRPGEPVGTGVDCVVHLAAAEGTPTDLVAEYPWWRDVVSAGPRCLLAAGRPGVLGGLDGFLRVVAVEYPTTTTRLVELAVDRSPTATAALLVAELRESGGDPVVRWSARGREVVEPVLADLAVPETDPVGTLAARELGLDGDAVLLFVGGARGITARLAETLVTAAGCRLELVGRTAVPTHPEGPGTAGIDDPVALRAALAARGGDLARVEQSVRLLLAARQVGATVDALRGRGGLVRYHQADATDAQSLRAVVKDVLATHGRLDGVVVAAGVIEDRRIADKDAASFRRVFDAKVGAARNVVAALENAPARARFALLYGSIAAVTGNAGQADYAAANAALAELGATMTGVAERVLTVHWGPWAPDDVFGGMVDADLARRYAARGVGLVEPGSASAAVLRELAWGVDDVVVHAAPGWRPVS